MLQYGYVRGCESPRDEPLTPWVDRKSTERPTILEGSAELPKRSVHVNRITRTATTKEQLRNMTDVLRHSTSLKEALGCAPGETQYRQRSPVLAASQLDLYPTESMALAGDVSETAPDDFTPQFPTYEPSGCSRGERGRSAQVALRRSQDSYTDDTPRKIRKLPGQRCSTTDDFNRKRLLAARAMRQSVKTRSEPVLCRSRSENIPTENIAEVKSPDKEWKAANDVSDQPEIVRWLKHMCPSVECSGIVQHTSGPCQVAAASVECDRVTSCDGYVTSGESATTPGNNWSVESMAILSSASLLHRLDCMSSASVDNTDVSAATVVGDWALSPRQNTIGTRDVIGPRGDDVVSSFDDVDSPVDDVMTQQYGCSTQNDPVTMTDSCQSNDCNQLREAVNETRETTVTFSANDINLTQYDSEQLTELEENRTDYNYQQQQPTTTTTTAVYYMPDKSQTNDDYHLHEPVTVVDPDSTDSDTGLSQDDATDESQTDYRNDLPARATHSASEATTIADQIIHPDEEFQDDYDYVALAALTQDDSHVDSDTCESYAAETLMPSQQEWYLAHSPGAAEYEYIDVGRRSTHHGLDPTSGLRRQWRNSQQRQCSKPIRRCPTRGGIASSMPYLIPRPRSRQQTYDKEIKRTTCNQFGLKETEEASVEMEWPESSWVQPFETEQVKEGSDKGMSPVGMSYMNVEQERRTVCTDIHNVGGKAPRTQSCTDSKHHYCPIKDSANVDKTRPDFSAESRWHRSEPGRSTERKTPDVGRREPLEVNAESRCLPSGAFLHGPKLRRTDTRKTPDVGRREPLEVNAESRHLPSCAFLHGPEPRRTDTQRSVQTFRPEARRGRSSSPEKRASSSVDFDRQKVMSNTDSQRACSSTEANQGGTRIDIRQDRWNTEAYSRDTPAEKLRDSGINQLRRLHSDEITRRPSSSGLLAVEKCEERANQSRNSRSLSSERRQDLVVDLPHYEPLRRRARSRDECRLDGREPNCRADDVEKRRSVHFTKLPCQADARQGQERPRVGSINKTRRTGPVTSDVSRRSASVAGSKRNSDADELRDESEWPRRCDTSMPVMPDQTKLLATVGHPSVVAQRKENFNAGSGMFLTDKTRTRRASAKQGPRAQGANRTKMYICEDQRTRGDAVQREIHNTSADRQRDDDVIYCKHGAIETGKQGHTIYVDRRKRRNDGVQRTKQDINIDRQSPAKGVRTHQPDTVTYRQSPARGARTQQPDTVTNRQRPDKGVRTQQPDTVTYRQSPDKGVRTEQPDTVIYRQRHVNGARTQQPDTVTYRQSHSNGVGTQQPVTVVERQRPAKGVRTQQPDTVTYRQRHANGTRTQKPDTVTNRHVQKGIFYRQRHGISSSIARHTSNADRQMHDNCADAQWHSTDCNGSSGADETKGAVGTDVDVRMRVVTEDGQPRNGQQSVGCPTNNLPSGWESGLKERKGGQRKDWPPSSRNIHRVEDGKPAMVRGSRVPTRPSISCEQDTQGTRHIHFSADMRWSGNEAAGRATSSARPTVASPLSRPSRPKRPDRIPLSPICVRRNISPRRELTMSSPERRPAADVTNSGSSTYRKSADKMSINNNSRNVAHRSPSNMTSDDCSVAEFKPLLVRRFGVRRTTSEIPVRQKTNRTRSASPCSRSYSVPVRCPSDCTRSVRRASRADSLIPTRRTSSDASVRERAVCCGSSPSRSGGGSHVRQRPDIPRVARENGLPVVDVAREWSAAAQTKRSSRYDIASLFGHVMIGQCS